MTSLLIADDTEIARAGLRQIIALEPELSIVGEAIAPEQVITGVVNCRPDVLLLDLIWGADRTAGLRLLGALERLGASTKVIAISHDDTLLENARRVGVTATLSKTFSPAELFAVIRAVSSDGWPAAGNPSSTVARVREYRNRLQTIEVGLAGAFDYERVVEDILRLTLSGHLTNFQRQVRHADGSDVWDLVAFNNSSHPFWTTMRIQHHATQIIFEVKNTRLLTGDAVLQLGSYLDNPLFHVGVLVTRQGPSTAARRKAWRLLERRRDVVLLLTDQDLYSMLEAIETGTDAGDVMEHAYLQLVRQGRGGST